MLLVWITFGVVSLSQFLYAIAKIANIFGYLLDPFEMLKFADCSLAIVQTSGRS